MWLAVKVQICLGAYVCAYVGMLYIWVKGGRRKGKWAMCGYENDELGPANPYFPTDTKRGKTPISIFFFSVSSCLLFTNCDVTSVLKLWEALGETWVLLGAKQIHLLTFVNLGVIYWSLLDLLKELKKWAWGWKHYKRGFQRISEKCPRMRDIYLRLIVASCGQRVQSMADDQIN